MLRSFAQLLAPLALIASVALTGCAEDGPPLNLASDVSLEEYTGVWYEIARLPNRFEKDCTGVTAEYTLLEDGWVDVKNTCFKDSLDGDEKVANGKARLVDESNNAMLEVSFFGPFYGNYQIMMVDEASYSLVGEPKREFLWLLSRTPTLEADVQEELLARAEAEGFDTSALIWTVQPEVAE